MKKIFSLLALVLFINLFTYQAQAQTAVVNINKTSVSLKELIQEVEKTGRIFVCLRKRHQYRTESKNQCPE